MLVRNDASREARRRWLSHNLRQLMNEREVTVTALAALIAKHLQVEQFSPANVSHYRAGRALPRPEVMLAICEALAVTSERLFVAPTDNEDRSILNRGIKFDQHDTPSEPAFATAASPIRSTAQASDAPLKLPGEFSARQELPRFHVEDLGNDEAWLMINQALPWPTVIKILQVC